MIDDFNEAEFRAWAERTGMTLDIKNNGHHWIMRDAEGVRADLWPSTRKLVFNLNHADATVVDSTEDLISALTAYPEPRVITTPRQGYLL